MFRIRRVRDVDLALRQGLIAQVQDLLSHHFPKAPPGDIEDLPSKLSSTHGRFRSVLLVADRRRHELEAFAILLTAADPAFCFLDYIASNHRLIGRGIGGALYQRVREEARRIAPLGLFMECLPDERRLCPDERLLRENSARLRFYERFGVRPVAGTAYETPVREGDTCAPFLCFDDLGSGRPLRREPARRIVRAILEGKYSWLCPPAYVDRIVASFRDDPVRLRPPRYGSAVAEAPVSAGPPEDERIVLVVNYQHSIHHVRERGYVEAPVRIASILRELDRLPVFHGAAPHRFSEDHIRAVHVGGFIDYFKRVCASLPADRAVYPYVFPVRNRARPPRELSVRAGYYCIDTFTPLTRNAFLAARRAVDCALTGATALLDGAALAYALVRPPGHHAESRVFGGFCYFNSNAIAANFLATRGRVAILDIDFHHGNGQQDIFYQRPDVLTVSIHGHPRFAYPYFSGFEDEVGRGAGEGFNLNLPLGENVDGQAYREVLLRALRRIERFAPSFLVVALGLDTARGDPTGSWLLRARDFEGNGRAIGALGLPTLVVQEGGYDTRVLGVNARHFFKGLWDGSRETVS